MILMHYVSDDEDSGQEYVVFLDDDACGAAEGALDKAEIADHQLSGYHLKGAWSMEVADQLTSSTRTHFLPGEGDIYSRRV